MLSEGERTICGARVDGSAVTDMLGICAYSSDARRYGAAAPPASSLLSPVQQHRIFNTLCFAKLHRFHMKVSMIYLFIPVPTIDKLEYGLAARPGLLGCHTHTSTSAFVIVGE